MKRFQVNVRYSLESLEMAMRDFYTTKLKRLIIFFCFLIFFTSIIRIYWMISENFYSAAIHAGLDLVAYILLLFMIMVIVLPKAFAHLLYLKLKRRYGDKIACTHIFIVQESYIYSRWEEDSEETELGQILKLESFKEHLFIWIGFLDPVSETDGRVKLKRRLCIVRKDAFIQGTAKELYDHLKETYPQMKFSPWRDGKKRVL